jgi:amino acid permease
MLTLVSTAMGGGVLSVSYVMYLCGLGLGTCMIFTGGALSYMSTKILMQLSTKTKKYTYAGLFAYCAGPRAGPVLDAMLFIYGNGSCVGYLCFLGDFIPSLLALICGHAPDPWWRPLSICLCALMTLPLDLQKDLSALRFVAPVSIVALLYMSAVVTGKAPGLFKDHKGDSHYGDPALFRLDANFPQAFALCVFAFNCHLNVVPVAGALLRPTKARIKKVALVVNIVQILFYALIGCAGYLSFLEKTPQDILKLYSATDPLVAGGRVMLTGTMLVAIPMNLVPTTRSGIQIRDFFSEGAPLLAPSPRVTPTTSPTTSPPGSPRAQGRGPCCMTRAVAVLRRRASFSRSSHPRVPSPVLPANTPGTGWGANQARIALTLVSLLFQVCVAICVPGVAIVLSILGGTVATAMMLAIPAYALGVVEEPSLKNRVQRLVLYAFALLAISSVPLTILSAAGLMHVKH